jgi:SH3 domain protein
VKSLYLALILLALTASSAFAQPTRYVTDQLDIDLRSGDSNQHRIVAMLRSGTAVTVLEENTSGWVRIRTAQGQEGWLMSRFLENTPIPRDRLTRAEQDLAKSNATIRELQEAHKSTTGSNSELNKRVEELTRANQTQEQELTQIRRTSANAIALDDENRTLKERLNRLERDHQMLEQQTDSLKDRKARDWFFAGAGVLLIGMLLGLIVPKIRWKRKSAWNSF